jgi:hypothetical protein
MRVVLNDCKGIGGMEESAFVPPGSPAIKISPKCLLSKNPLFNFRVLSTSAVAAQFLSSVNPATGEHLKSIF